LLYKIASYIQQSILLII